MNYNNELNIKDLFVRALSEDIGKKDITTDLVIPVNKSIKAVILAKQDCAICGLAVALYVFKLIDKNIRFKALVKEGASVKKGKILAKVEGRARSILTAERVALNFLSMLSAVSTKTRKFVEAALPYKAKIIDTRKTIPGLRILEKYAVRIGGGFNHRMYLDDMVLVKDNHLKVVGGIDRLPKIKSPEKIEIEVKNIKEFKQALNLKPDIIMLDNMSIEDMKRAVRLKHGSPVKIEASGGITLNNVKQVASTGVDMISIGALTHSLDSVDISLEII